MIDKALNLILEQLNGTLGPGAAGPEAPAVLSSLSNPDGSVPLAIDNKMVLSLVNIEREAAMGSPSFVSQSAAGTYAKGNPTLYLNVYVLLSASFRNNYATALRQLALAMRFFQSRQIFDAQNSPDFPPELERLTMEMVSLTMAELSTLWAVLGANYLPSVVYKLRMLPLQADAMIEPAAPVVAPTPQWRY